MTQKLRFTDALSACTLMPSMLHGWRQTSRDGSRNIRDTHMCWPNPWLARLLCSRSCRMIIVALKFLLHSRCSRQDHLTIDFICDSGLRLFDQLRTQTFTLNRCRTCMPTCLPASFPPGSAEVAPVALELAEVARGLFSEEKYDTVEVQGGRTSFSQA